MFSMRRMIAAALAGSFLAAGSAFAQGAAGTTPIVGISTVTNYSVDGRVTAIDPTTRNVTLTIPNGSTVSRKVSPDVTNLGIVKVGDDVFVGYQEKLTFVLSGPNARPPRDRDNSVVVGAADADDPAIRETVDRLCVGDRVHRLGYVSDHELSGIVVAARLLVFPSLYEGFGMPVVEAMSVGVPVAASAHASLDEACGDAAVRFDPLNVAAMAASISSVLDDARRASDLITRGRAHAALFTWAAAGEEIAKAIEETVA